MPDPEKVQAPEKPKVDPARKLKVQIVYAYDPASGEYLGTCNALESALEPDVFHLPANSTATAPPAMQHGKAAVWNKDAQAWQQVTDLRGQTVYDTATGVAAVVGSLGDPPKALTLLKPGPGAKWTGSAWATPTSKFDKWDGAAWQPDLAAARKAKLGAIAQEENVKLADLSYGYMPAEIATWPQQYAEANAYLTALRSADAKAAAAGQSAPVTTVGSSTPLLQALAQSRGMDPADLAKKILAKAQAYHQRLATASGNVARRAAAVQAAVSYAAIDNA
ncbi:MAG TPA: tail fiber assembly protein [Nevskia sp.]|jgi:hypothetical protein|nr:tail fiber assembly protein [Nevskia sp.]